MTGGQVMAQIVISEFHYEDVTRDDQEIERIEIFAPEGTNLAGYILTLYGSNDKEYDTIRLAGTIIGTRMLNGRMFGALAFDCDELKNGTGGIALTDPSGGLLDFISYEGVITAKDGLAQNSISEDIGVSETNSTPVNYALWRPNARFATFNASLPNTFGQVNTALLPIKLKEFNVSRRGEQVGVKWVASNTAADSYYEVQRSTGQSTFETLARIRATGVGEFSYSYSDAHPVKGNAIYRLKLIDPDDNTMYSQLARLKWTQKDLFINNIYPTVARSGITVQLNSDRKYTTAIEVFDFTGKMVQKKQIVLTEGNMNYPVDVSNLRSGNYTLRILVDGEVLTGNFIRQ
jgi:hypothetical protein